MSAAPAGKLAARRSAILCLRAAESPQAAERARACLADPNFDWHAFVAYMQDQRIGPLIHEAAGALDLLSPEAAGAARTAYLQNLWVNALRLEELNAILDRLAEAAVSTILLKGAALLHTVYPKSGLRPMVDLDLLIPAEGMARADEALRSCGYERAMAPSAHPDYQVEVAYTKQGRAPWLVELHTSLFNAPHQLSRAQLDWFWQHRACWLKDGREICTFDSTAQVLHLCAHLWLHHEGDSLMGMIDLYHLLRRNSDQVRWEELLAIAPSFDLLLPLQKALPELADTWGAAVPPQVLSRLADLVPSARERRKFGLAWGENQNYLRTLLGGAMSYTSWRSRFNYARQILFPPRQYILERYQVRRPLLAPLYYAYRLAARALQQAWRLRKK